MPGATPESSTGEKSTVLVSKTPTSATEIETCLKQTVIPRVGEIKRKGGGQKAGVLSALDTPNVMAELEQPLMAGFDGAEDDSKPLTSAPSPRLQRICPLCFPPKPPKPYSV